MDIAEIASGFRWLWENQPGMVVLLCLGFVLFLFLVVDTWRHRHRRKRSR